MTRFKTGTRAQVLRHMAECAIRDRQAMIDAHTFPEWQPKSESSEAVIADCRATIADFKRLAGQGKEASK